MPFNFRNVSVLRHPAFAMIYRLTPWWTISLLIAAGMGAGALRARGEEAAFTMSVVRFQSGGRDIQVDDYRPSTGRPRVTILVLPGAGGTLLDGDQMKQVAQALARDGDAACVVHYFDRTGTLFARDAVMQENFETWLGTVREAIRWAQARQSGERRRIGIYGYSLGAFLALAAASDNDGVGAVVEHSGGVWNGKESRIQHMPPVLILHGTADRRVPFQTYAKPLMALLRRRGARFAAHPFPGEGHGFSAPAEAQARALAVGFFHRHLRNR